MSVDQPGEDDERAIAGAHFAGQIVDSVVQVAGQLGRERLDDFKLVVHVVRRSSSRSASRESTVRLATSPSDSRESITAACSCRLLPIGFRLDRFVELVGSTRRAVCDHGRIIDCEPLDQRLARSGGPRCRRAIRATVRVAVKLTRRSLTRRGQFGGQRQLLGPAPEAAHQAAIRVDADEAADESVTTIATSRPMPTSSLLRMGHWRARRPPCRTIRGQDGILSAKR